MAVGSSMDNLSHVGSRFCSSEVPRYGNVTPTGQLLELHDGNQGFP